MNVTKKFYNFTDLPDSEAEDLVGNYRDLVNTAETELRESLDTAQRMLEIHKNKVWDEADMAFFESFDATPIEFSVARPLINQLISEQRKKRFKFNFVPLDIHSYNRHMNSMESFLEKNISLFESAEDATEFFENYGDDEYAKMVTGLMTKFRSLSKGKYKESEVFEGGVITGADFFKADQDFYGRPTWSRRSFNRMIWDTNSVQYDMSDAEFIGDKVRWYKNDLVFKFPDHKDDIEEYFEHYTRLRKANKFRPNTRWKDWWKFTDGNTDQMQLKVVDLYYKTFEERIRIIDAETGDEDLAKPGMTEDDVFDGLAMKVATDMEESGQLEQYAQEDIRSVIMRIVEERFSLETEFTPVWFQMVFSYNTLFLHQRTTHPKGIHPYTGYFPQFNDGNFTGFLEDIEDIVIALNKAIAIRELIMSHSAKGLVVVDETVLNDSGISLDDIADEYTRIGGMIALKLKYNKTVQDAIQQITTVGDALPAMNAIIQDYDERLYRISGVNLAQLGITQSETPTSRYKMQLAQGEATNGLIFDNYIRSLECFYEDHIVPMAVAFAKANPNSVGRLIGENLGQWTVFKYDRDYELFESAVMKGEFAFTLVPAEDNPQLNAEREAKMFEMGVNGLIPLEIAFEYSTHPSRYEIIKKIKLVRRQQMLEQLQNQIDLQQIQQIVLNDSQITAEMADRIIKKARLAVMEKEQSKPKGGSGMQEIMKSANMTKKTQGIEQSINQTALR